MKKPFAAVLLWLVSIFMQVSGVAAFELDRPECLVPARVNGGLDLTCRLAAKTLKAADLIDNPMLIQYKPGGVGAVAYNYIAGIRDKDPQLIVAASSGSALNIAINKFGRYDVNAVRWVAALGADYGIIAVRADAPWLSLGALLQSIKENPDRIVFGGGGSIGSQDWIKTALVLRAAGIDPKSIRYASFEGGGEAALSLLKGTIQVLPGDAAEVNGLLREGRVRILALLAKERLPGLWADIPTAREQGFPVDWTIWRGYYLGPHVSDDAYNFWVNTFRRLSRTEEFRQEREQLGLYPFEMFGAQFEAFVRQSVGKYRKAVADMGFFK